MCRIVQRWCESIAIARGSVAFDASARRVLMVALALRAPPQVGDKHGNSDHAHRDGCDPARAPAEPHPEDDRSKQDREQCREPHDVVWNSIGLAIQILGRAEASIITYRVLMRRHGVAPSRGCATT